MATYYVTGFVLTLLSAALLAVGLRPRRGADRCRAASGCGGCAGPALHDARED